VTLSFEWIVAQHFQPSAGLAGVIDDLKHQSFQRFRVEAGDVHEHSGK
jgi:hypothetical protein